MTRIFFFLLAAGLFFSSCNGDTTANSEQEGDVSAAPTTGSVGSGERKLNPNQLKPDPDEARQERESDPLLARLIKGKESDLTLTKIVMNIKNNIGSNFLKSVDLNNGTVSIVYFDTAKEYNETLGENGRRITDQLLKGYWDTGFRGAKVLTTLPGQILKDYPDVNTVKIELPTDQKVYELEVTRDGIAELVDSTWEEIVADWNVKYTNNIVRSPDNRVNFIQKFVK